MLPSRSALQRLFSMFPDGLPGAGLLLLRVVCSCLVIATAIATFVEKPQTLSLVQQSAACAAALLLLVGLWTPIAGVAIAVLELWTTVSRMNGMENAVLLATLGVALAVLGPGSYSVDAKLFGRKRILVRNH
jgi:putative oxidoreductase